MKPIHIRVFTAFSGYDSQCLALDRLSRDYPNFSYELVGWSEIDKSAINVHHVGVIKRIATLRGVISRIFYTLSRDERSRPSVHNIIKRKEVKNDTAI